MNEEQPVPLPGDQKFTDEEMDAARDAANDIITGKHWLPDTVEDWNLDGDLRQRLLFGVGAHARAKGFDFVFEDAVEYDPEDPAPVKVISSNWIHANVHGVMTPEIFYADLTEGIRALAIMIAEDQNPWQPVRIYKEASNAYGVGFFDFLGDEFRFDVRVVVQFGSWAFPIPGTEESVGSTGFKFHIATLVIPTEDDKDVYVGQDWGKIFDAE